MRRFHTVAVTGDLEKVLAIQTSAGWLLPCLEDDARSELPAQVRAMLGGILGGTGTAELLHEAPLTDGLSSADESESYCVAIIEKRPRPDGIDGAEGADGHDGEPNLLPELTPVDRLLSGRALLPQQQEALVSSLARLRAAKPDAPFDTPAQMTDALDWAAHQIAARTGAEVVSVERHRCMRHDYVAWFDTNAGRIYFKGGPDRVQDEATVTGLLRQLSPLQFPETLVIDREHQRWLYRELPGQLLIGPLLTVEHASAAVRALASVQKLALDLAPEEPGHQLAAHLAHRRMTAVELLERADRIVEQAWKPAAADADRLAPLLDGWRASRASSMQQCAEIDAMQLPQTIVLSDFWGRNILLRPDGGIGFIDVEQSYWSCPVLSLWRFFNELDRHIRPYDAAARAEVEQHIVDAWAELGLADAMRKALDRLPLLGRLFGIVLASHELDLQERGLGAPLPAGCRAVHLARHVERFIGSAGNS